MSCGRRSLRQLQAYMRTKTRSTPALKAIRQRRRLELLDYSKLVYRGVSTVTTGVVGAMPININIK